MINWLYQTGLDISLLIGVVLVLRYPVRKYLGANVAYWLWLIPLVRIFAWNKAEIPLAIMEKVNFANGQVFIKVFKNPESFNLSSYITYETLWIVGVIIWLGLRVFGLLKFRQNISQSRSEIIHLSNKYNVSFFYTDNPSAPFLTGVFKPQIYLPNNFNDNLNDIQQQCVIKHELTHLNRKDLWMQLLAEFIRTIFWFNPVIHIAWKAFRQDQELACDYQVLAKSNQKERYEYGRILLNGLHAHALPATMAFFNNHKQRFIMLEKHNNSKVNNILGITLCAFLLIFALTKAPQSIATEPLEDTTITMKFVDIPLKSILELIFEASPKDVIGYENVPEIKINFQAWNVSANQLEKLILKCSNLELIPKNDQFEIIKGRSFNNDYSKLHECIQIDSNQKDVPPETVEAITKRNAKLRKLLKEKGKKVPEYGELPFEEN